MYDKSLLEKAAEVTSSDRMVAYGHPLINFLCEALVLSILTGQTYSPLDIVRQSYVKKICREFNTFKDDNHLDMAGYAATVDAMDHLMKELGYQSGVKNFDRKGGWGPFIFFMTSLLEMARDKYKLSISELDTPVPSDKAPTTVNGVTLE